MNQEKCVRHIVYGALLCMMLTACRTGETTNNKPITITATDQVDSTATGDVEASATPTIVKTVSAATPSPRLPTADPGAPLAENGPWLVFVTDAQDNGSDKTLWIANPDGTGLTQLTDKEDLAIPSNPESLQRVVSPSGDHLAYIASYEEPVLHILSLPGGEDRTVPLTIESTRPKRELNDTDYYATTHPLRSVTDPDSIAWSPDGHYLAFVGAQDGPSSDLYLYSVADGSVTRLTSGPTQACHPTWSPDGQYIIHAGEGEVDAPQGANMIEGVWAARLDGSDTKLLYHPQDSIREWFAGWIDTHTFLAYSVDSTGGLGSLRVVDMNTGQSQSVWSGRLSEYSIGGPAIMALDPGSGMVLISIDPYTPDTLPPGMYLANVNGGDPLHISDQDASKVWLPEPGTFYTVYAATKDGTVAKVLPTGEVLEITPPFQRAMPLFSPDGQFWAWYGAGLAIGPLSQGVPSGVIMPDISVDQAAWSPDGQFLAFLSKTKLYVTTYPGTDTRQLMHDLKEKFRDIAWASP
ncbi:MAG: PD40 domain-containing protein [Anaerolineae bacterium]|nr:PD40 domain-containing protein [Anaerolineae bacterium]